MIGRIDGIHMAGEEHLHRGVGAYREVQMVAVRLCTDGARGRDRLDRFGLDQPERSRQRREGVGERSEEHTSELQSLMRISYAVFCLKKKKNKQQHKKKKDNATSRKTQPNMTSIRIQTTEICNIK